MGNTESLSKEDYWLLEGRLWIAAEEGRVDDVSQLSTHFTGDVNTLGGALDTACEYGQLNVVTWMVEHTVLRDDKKRLRGALEEACRYGQWNIVKWLVNNTQFDIKYTDIGKTKNSILHHVILFSPTNPLSEYSLLRDMTGLCRLVYMCGEDVNVQDNDGDTPLHRACGHGDSDNVGALLLAGADETITNDEERTPVQYAMKYNNVKVLPLLDVSSKWKLLVRSHRLRRRTAVRVMMTLVKWKVQQTRSMWTRAIMTLHTIITCTVYTYRHNYQRMYTPRMYKRLRTNDSVAVAYSFEDV